MTDIFKVIKPLAVVDATLVATDVPEADYPVIANATAYIIKAGLTNGSRVISTTTHSIYECILAFTSATPAIAPDLDPAHWLRVSATNRWMLFDGRNSRRTAQATSCYYRLQPGVAINGLIARSLVGCLSVRQRLTDPVYGVVYDKTLATGPTPPGSDWWSFYLGIWSSGAPEAYFEDMPAFRNAELRVDFAGTSALAVGILAFGQKREWGLGVHYGAKVGIQDYSTKNTNQWGDFDLVQGPWADRASYTVLIKAGEVDAIKAYLADLRATPAYYRGCAVYQSTGVFGIYKDFDETIVGPTWTELDINLLGTT
jgi:hypothetical protein